MSYFRERNNIKTEYSGHQDASKNLRERLHAIVRKRAVSFVGDPSVGRYIQKHNLDHETTLRLNKDCCTAILIGSYDEAFESFEIFMNFCKKLFTSVFAEILSEAIIAFNSAGSVYTVDDAGHIILKISEETAKGLSVSEEQLASRSEDACEYFRRARHALLTRERKANDVIKDFAISLEKYLEALTGKKDNKEALRTLRETGIISAIQQTILEKLYAYRGDADGVAHSGNTVEPDEIDAIWFLETFMAQITLVESRAANT